MDKRLGVSKEKSDIRFRVSEKKLDKKLGTMENRLVDQFRRELKQELSNTEKRIVDEIGNFINAFPSLSTR